MAPTLDQLIVKRTTIKSKFTRIQTFVNSFNANSNIHLLKTRVTLANQAFQEYNSIQDEIDLLLDRSDKALVEKHLEYREEIENKYCEIIATIESKTESRDDAQTSNSGNHATFAHLPPIAPINIKPFSGCYKEWLTFTNTFKSIIEDNSYKLTDCQRFQHLRSCLEGEAKRSIEQLEASDENYQEAWKILESRFKNTRLIVQDHILSILKLPSLSKASHYAIRELLDTIIRNVTALKQLDIKIDEWHALIVPIIIEKLDYVTIRDWQATLDKDVPTYSSLIIYLEKRYRTLESISLINNKTNTPQTSNANQNINKKPRAVAHVVTNKDNSGSMSNYITTSLCKKLGLKQNPIHINIGGIGKTKSNIKYSTNVEIKSRYEKFSANMNCLILDQITENLPLARIDPKHLVIPNDKLLADPMFYDPGPIDILIGAGLFWELLCPNENSPAGELKLQATQLGFIVGGSLNVPHSGNLNTSSGLSITLTSVLEKQVEKFWELEQCRTVCTRLTDEELKSENHYKLTTNRAADGRFIVKLPFVNNPPILDSNRKNALRQFYNLERKLVKKPDLKADYSKFMREYKLLNHMEEVPPNEIENQRVTYLPHHAVFKESTSTKLRVVFNASSKTESGLSLNDNLLAGPTIQDDLFAILTRFRTFKYVLSGDITKMYRMILMHPEHTDYQRIFWRDNIQDELKTFRLTTLTYGTKPASFIAIRCLHELALQFKSQYPEAAKIIQRDFYVDDLLTGHNSVEELIVIRDQIIEILKHGGFSLRKWASNHSELIPDTLSHEQNLNIRLDKGEYTKPLGLLWNPYHDILNYSVRDFEYNVSNQITKREILSKTAQIFDPLGLIAPVIVTAKIVIQRLWMLKIGWDEPVPETIQQTWQNLLRTFGSLNQINIPRNIIQINRIAIEMHGFGDASQVAYGAAVYLRVTDSSENSQTHLIAAKSRIAPLKTITLPRLELSAALLLTRLMNVVSQALHMEINRKYFWSDSTIVLAWIKGTPASYQTFVGNRISEIQTLSPKDGWYHVKSEDNPADIISRGCTPENLKNNSLWWHGPHWLNQNYSEWPIQNINLETIETPERRTISLLSSETPTVELPILTKFSSYKKTERVVSWVLRFINNCKNPNSKNLANHLLTEELQNSKFTIARQLQKTAFQNEYNCLQQNQAIDKKSRLLSLNIFFDETNQLIRVGGRLKKSSLSYDIKHPILLPKGHHITKTLVQYEHEKQLHAGLQGTLASIRQIFWIPAARTVVRGVLHKCFNCFRTNPKPLFPPMGDLPKSRLEPTRPFLVSGVDYAGPLLIKECRGRSKRHVKAYICLFVCFSTKAIHLELVNDLTTESFLAAFNRLVARRGHVYHMYSDNATNFVGARNKLNELTEFLKSQSFRNVIQNLANKGIKWHFIPPKSPHMGGLWEGNIKSVKNHIKRSLNSMVLTYEELYTFLTRVEAILNSRPITPLSNDPNDLQPLTPGHFLIGEPLTAIDEQDITPLKVNRLSQWQKIERLRQDFWHRWKKEYLTQYSLRNQKFATQPDAIAVNTMVILVEENTPPLQWRLGRILDVHPGTDGVVRVVSIKTSAGVVKRAGAPQISGQRSGVHFSLS
ncbi:uncharacterized protein LOC135121564 [Zophobas morio]|uniref:uncharacterized protein LOC135121563 n=1 Tax=Zophobas morio TaxID=2755281 RepID=UPI003083ADF2